jgi:hypothetical protein
VVLVETKDLQEIRELPDRKDQQHLPVQLVIRDLKGLKVQRDLKETHRQVTQDHKVHVVILVVKVMQHQDLQDLQVTQLRDLREPKDRQGQVVTRDLSLLQVLLGQRDLREIRVSKDLSVIHLQVPKDRKEVQLQDLQVFLDLLVMVVVQDQQVL